MAAMHGKGGTGVWTATGITFEILSWSVDAASDVAESTAMAATSGAKIYLAGFKSWTATAEVLLPQGGVGLDKLGDTSTLTFDTAADGGLAYAGTAFFMGCSPSSDKDGISTVTLNFQGSGTLGEA